MSSISSNYPNPNPNPKSNQRKPSSSSTQLPKFNNQKSPNWLDLPQDIWSLIFSKLYTIHLIENVQKVCILFHKICKHPSLYRVVNMTLPDAFMCLTFDANILTKHIVDLSCGGLIDIYLEYLCDDDTLMYIVQRSKNLKHLRIGHYIYISDEGLIDAVKRLPKLEELKIIICSFCYETIEEVGHICPSLKSFSWNDVGSHLRESYNEEALAIAKSMPNLRRLQLIGKLLNNEGLKAILDGCPHLEYLDLRACFKIDLSGDLGKRCGNIKHLRLPNDSTAGYSHQAREDDMDMWGPNTRYYDSNNMDSDGFFGYIQDYAFGDDSEDDYYDSSNDEFDCYGDLLYDSD